MPKISIIVPVYNVENYLDVCLDSIIAQSYKDFEVICVNDGSTDSSPDILERYSKFDKRIKVFHIEKNGVLDTRNYGMEHITGEYTMFVDSDDWISHLMLERLHNNITAFNSDFNFCGVRTINNVTRDTSIWQLYTPEEFKSYIKTPYFNEAEVHPEFIYKIHFVVWGKLYKSEFVKKFRFIHDKIFEDNPFFVECYLAAKRISYDHAPLYYYRRNRKDSVMKTKSNRFKDIFDIADIVKTVYKKYGKFERYKKYYLLFYLKTFFFNTINIQDTETREKSFDLMKKWINKIDLSEYDEEQLKKDKSFNLIYSIKDMDYPQFMTEVDKARGDKW